MYLSIPNSKINEATDGYRSRRQQQMLLFLICSSTTILTSRFAYRSTVSRQFIPRYFQGNHSPPTSYNFTADAAVAVGTGTLLAASVSGMLVTGTCWILDISSFKEFGWKMKSLMGGNNVKEVVVDQESLEIQQGLNDLLQGKIDLE